MPGQRKRRNRQEAAARGRAETPGRWEPLLATQDQAEFRTHVRRLAAERVVAPERLRLDTCCGRLTHPTTHRLSIFVPEPGARS